MGALDRDRTAAVALSGADDIAASIGMRLLADVKEEFGGMDHLATSDLLDGLCDLEASPWGEW